MFSIIWGLAAALMLGVADFAARESGQREGSLRTLLYVQLIGSPLTFIIVLFGKAEAWPNLISVGVALGVLSGILLTVGNMLFYRALVMGPMLIVAPITSSFALVTILLSLLSGERLTSMQMIGIIVTLCGIILATTASRGFAFEPDKPGVSWRSSGIGLAIVAAVLFGVSIWLMKFATLRLGSQFTLLLLRQTALIVMVIVFLFTRRSPYLSSNTSLKWIIPIAVLDTIATLFINIGLQSGLASIVSVITSLYSVVTIVLGFILLKERITRPQQIGIGFTLVGVVLASI
jgi:drug/metabolite transporter (DMT)-like permease